MASTIRKTDCAQREAETAPQLLDDCALWASAARPNTTRASSLCRGRDADPAVNDLRQVQRGRLAGAPGRPPAARLFGGLGPCFPAYGPGDPPRRLIPSVLGALRAGKPVPTTQGRQQRDFIYARDAADLLIRLLLSQEDGGTLAPAPGEPAILVAA